MSAAALWCIRGRVVQCMGEENTMSHTTVKIISDSQHPLIPSARITTFEVYAPRFLLAEINTHRVLAKSAASSRAIPVKKRIEMVRDHGFVPSVFGKNKPGMQAGDTLDELQTGLATDVWSDAMADAVVAAVRMEQLGIHKQHANRILEPFAYYHGIVTATEWDNFFALRLHPDAQPEFQELARAMKNAMDASTPVLRRFHLPYVDSDPSPDIQSLWLDVKFKVAAARCARISYQTHDGKPFDLERDVARCEELIKGGHMSPFDHAATADGIRVGADGLTYWNTPLEHRQNWGFIPNRVVVEREAGMIGRRCSHAPIPNL